MRGTRSDNQYSPSGVGMYCTVDVTAKASGQSLAGSRRQRLPNPILIRY